MDSQPQHFNSQVARLCPSCEILQFNDAEFGGFERVSSTGGRYLDFVTGKDNTAEFDLDFRVEDTLPDLPVLSENARSGCDFCAYLKTVLQSDDIQCCLSDAIPDMDGRSLPVAIGLCYRWGPWLGYYREGLDSLVVHLDVYTNGLLTVDGAIDLELEIILTAEPLEYGQVDNDSCAKWLRLSSLPERDYLSERSLQWMKSYLQQCSEGEHSEKCASQYRITETNVLPTRLIDITGPVPRLIYTSNIPTMIGEDSGHDFRYAALSYCWGSRSNAKLQTKTEIASESQRLAGIPVSSLTKVLAEAVSFTKALSLSYLWVDALCIIQDDESDWQRESSRMGEVYANAYVTICALSASCHSSFLTSAPRIIIPFRSYINHDSRGLYSLRYRDCAVGKLVGERGLLGVQNSRWWNRGWTHQEFAMSARILMVGPHFAYFLCPSFYASEEWSEDGEWHLLLRGISTDLDELYFAWAGAVATEHSERQFSNRQDAFPALSGLAKHFADATNDEYVAGLWKQDLLRGLLWNLQHSRKRGTLDGLLATLSCPDSYVAPSWSWVGRRCIDYEFHPAPGIYLSDIQPECIIDATVSVPGLNPFGKVRSGRLKVKAKTCRFDPSTEIYFSNRFHLNNGAIVDCNFDWEFGLLEEADDQLRLLVLLSLKRANSDMNYMKASREERLASSANDVVSEPNQGQRKKDVYGLVIRAARLRGKFYRVGIFESLIETGGGLDLEGGFETSEVEIL